VKTFFLLLKTFLKTDDFITWDKKVYNLYNCFHTRIIHFNILSNKYNFFLSKLSTVQVYIFFTDKNSSFKSPISFLPLSSPVLTRSSIQYRSVQKHSLKSRKRGWKRSDHWAIREPGKCGVGTAIRYQGENTIERWKDGSALVWRGLSLRVAAAAPSSVWHAPWPAHRYP